jgi:hypothetical protein
VRAVGDDFRIVELSIQTNHVHLIVEADDDKALSSASSRVVSRRNAARPARMAEPLTPATRNHPPRRGTPADASATAQDPAHLDRHEICRMIYLANEAD